MSEKKGLSLIYGDFWEKNKIQICYSLFFGSIFSFSIFNLFYIRNNFDNIKLYFIHVLKIIGHRKLLCMTYYSITLSIIFTIIFIHYNYISFFRNTLNNTFNDIFIKNIEDHKNILIRNYMLNMTASIKSIILITISFIPFSILFLIGILLGFLVNTYIIIFIKNDVLNIINTFNSIPNFIKDLINFISTNFNKIIDFYNLLNNNYKLLLTLIFLFILIPLYDTVFVNINKLNRDNIYVILKNGLRGNIISMNIIHKITNFISLTILCLFTDITSISLNIPVINDRNIDRAFKETFEKFGNHYVARVPFSPRNLDELKIADLPEEYRKEIISTFKDSFGEYLDVFKEMKETLSSLQETIRKLNPNTNSIIYALAENQCLGYAVIMVPSANRISRNIMMLWCNDDLVKTRIINRIRYLDEI